MGIAGQGNIHHVAVCRCVAGPLAGAAWRSTDATDVWVRAGGDGRAGPRRDQFLFSLDEGGAENNQFFLQEKSGGKPRRITDGKSRNMGPRWSRSGDLLAWSSNARNGRDMDLYVAAPGDAHFVRRFKEVSGQWTVADWSPDETRATSGATCTALICSLNRRTK